MNKSAEATKTVMQWLKAGLSVPIGVGVGMANEPPMNSHQTIALEGDFESDDDNTRMQSVFRKALAIVARNVGLAAVRTSVLADGNSDGTYSAVTWVREQGAQGQAIQFISVFMDEDNSTLSVEVGDLEKNSSDARLVASLLWPKLRSKGYFPTHS